MASRWKVRHHDSKLVEDIIRDSKVSPVLAQLLALRGISRPAQVASFLDMKMTGLHPPEALPGLTQAVEIIYTAITDQKKIVVYGDYDCDGMTATAILVRTLKHLDADVSYFVPNRLTNGYGLNSDALKQLKDQKGAQLIITVDCGITNVDEVRFAKQQGMQIVVTDHHQFGPSLPDADAVVHPALPGFDYPFAGLCGAGVAFKLAWALCQCHHGSPKLPEPMRDLLFGAIALAAIGTVADVVPLLDENRILVHHGLRCLRPFANPGLTHLIELAKLDQNKRNQLEAEDLAFTVGPRLNAAGRLGQALLGVELLVCEKEERAKHLADYLEQLNQERTTLDRRILKEANRLLKETFDPETDPALVLAGSDWHLGVLGIVAGRIASTHHRPTVIISTDPLGNRPAIGSCRTAGGINLHEALEQCQEHLISFGGHAAAAGLNIQPENIDTFRAAFYEQVAQQATDSDPIHDLDIDAEVLLGSLTLATMNEIEKLAPFGQDNPRPILCATDVQLAAPAKTMSDGKHLDLKLKQHNTTIRAIAFGKGDWAEELLMEQPYDFAFRPVINEFRGYRSVELMLIDFRLAQSPLPVSNIP